MSGQGAGSDARDPERFEVLTEDECRQLLGTQHLGRIALTVEGQPEIMPVNYMVGEGTVVFRTAPGLKLERGAMSRVAFEVDQVDTANKAAWSVVVKGTLHDITDAADRISEDLRQAAVHPLAPGRRIRWMAILPDNISGRRFALPPTGPTPWLRHQSPE